MKCEKAQYHLFLLSEGEELPSDVQRRLNDHLGSCKSCQAFQELMSQTNSLLGEAADERECLAADDPLVRRVMERLATQREITRVLAESTEGTKGRAAQLPEVEEADGGSGSLIGYIGEVVAGVAGYAFEHAAITAVAALILCGFALGGIKAVTVLRELVRLRHEAEQKRAEYEQKQAEYDQAWKAVRFDEIVRPVISRLPGEPGGKPNSVRVELNPRVEDGWVRDVKVQWGDADAWEWIYEAAGPAKALAAVHEYGLPPEREVRAWTLQVEFTVTDAVAAARLLTRDDLTWRCTVDATPEGIRLLPSDDKQLMPQVVEPGVPQIRWLSPTTGSGALWRATVTLKSPTDTERVTLLVRPRIGSTYYVSAGARPLSADRPESFEVQLGGGRSHAVGAEFDILAVVSDTFMPRQWSLDMSEVPHASVAGRVTVRKVAGMISVDAGGAADQEFVTIRGEISTPDGGALLVKEGQEFTVLETFAPSPVGSRFDKKVPVPPPHQGAIYLAVYKEGAPALRVGQRIAEISNESYWLYGATTKSGEVERGSLE